MKKIILSAAVAAMAFSTSAFAADKGIDIDVSGQAVVYYETHSDNATGDKGQFDQANSRASAGIQLNLASDLGNNFTFGSQLTYLNSLGLEKSLVGGVKQSASVNQTNLTDQLALTKIFIAKKIGNTTVKAGRQELPKSLSPLAFTEGWNVYKNTFDAILAVNTDLPKTTLVGAYVTGGTGMGLSTTGDLAVGATGATYMVTAQTKLIPMTTLTGSYYALKDVGSATVNVGADAYWIDATIAPKDAPLGLKIGLQAGKISPDGTNTDGTTTYDDTSAYGAKLSGKAGAVSFKAIYTTVDGKTNAQVAMRNTGTNIKTALYSQMMYNQNAITLDNDTIVIGAGYNAGSIGKFAINYGMTTIGEHNTNVNKTTTADQD